MREIKFRGKRLDNGEWVCGVPIPNSFGNRTFMVHLVLGDKVAYPFERLHEYCLEIDAETISQDTGLKDKNKLEIFDQDIAEVSMIERFGFTDPKTGKLLTGKCNALIGIHEGHTYIWLKVPCSTGVLNIGAKNLINGIVKYESEGRLMTSSVKVIGNIYENPELLKTK